jgi:hypothetical protein
VTQFLGLGNAKENEINFALCGVTQCDINVTRYLSVGSATISMTNYTSVGRGNAGIVIENVSAINSGKLDVLLFQGNYVPGVMSYYGNHLSVGKGLVLFPKSSDAVLHLNNPEAKSCGVTYQFTIFSK